MDGMVPSHAPIVKETLNYLLRELSLSNCYSGEGSRNIQLSRYGIEHMICPF